MLDQMVTNPKPYRLTELGELPSAGGPGRQAHQLIGVPIHLGDTLFAVLYLAEKNNGTEFSAADEDLLATLATAAVGAITNARHADDSRRQQAWLAASADITTTLLGADPAEALRLVAAGARVVAGADIAWIEASNADRTSRVRAWDGPLKIDAEALEAPVGGTPLLREVSVSGQPILIDDAAEDDRATASGLFEARNVGPLMVVPLQAGELIMGALLIGNDHGGPPFNALDVEMATAFAANAALALEFDRALNDRQRLSLIEDRDRIARDLHDQVIRRLFAASLDLVSIASGLDATDTARRIVQRADDIEQVIRDLRASIYQIRDTSATGRQ
jgi:GAF domain-containing protein